MKKIMVFCGIFLFPLFSFSQEKQNSLNANDSIISIDEIIVTATRASRNTPVTFSQISKKEIKQTPSSHSIPMMLALQPSVVATTEGGLGLGYTKMSVRGTDDSRTNITLNGMALNDAESQQVFWVNIPSMHSFLKSAQLQRGVGTSSNGAAAFGASLNLETNTANYNPYGIAEFSFGSYQTYMTTIGAGTGISKKGLSFDVIYSHNNTKGYIRNAKANLNSLYATAGWQNTNNVLKLNYIFGDQKTGITWEGIPLIALSESGTDYYSNRRYNPAGKYYDEFGNVHYYDNETDNYKQHHLQATYSHRFSKYLTWNTSVNYTKGDGYYKNYKYDTKFSKYGLKPQKYDDKTYSKSDLIIKQAMDNNYYSANSFVHFSKGSLKLIASASYSLYDGDHFGNVLWSKINENIPDNYRWYKNNGTKNDYSAFLRAERNINNKIIIYADLQYRGINYELSGPDKDFVSLNWKNNYNFINPKAGITYSLSDKNKFYASFAISNREPSRSDIKESIKSGIPNDIKSERLTDIEVGYKYLSNNLILSANLYFMEYKDQLVATGKLSDVGYSIKQNIPDSYRRGIEFIGAWNINKNFRFDANLTLSRNKLTNYTAYIDTYNNPNEWEYLPQTKVFLKESNLILSPQIIGMAMFSYNSNNGFNISLNGKYVGEQFMDNYNSKESKVPAYFVAGLNIAKNFKIRENNLKIALTIDNLLNNKYYSYGWIYQARFEDGSKPYIEQGVYAQAPINYLINVSWSF